MLMSLSSHNADSRRQLGESLATFVRSSSSIASGSNSLIGVIAAPWMLGQVIGGIIGANLLTSLRASAVRSILILILFASSLKLVARGVETLMGIEIPVL